MLSKIREHKGYFFLGFILLWYGLAKAFFGRATFELAVADNTPITTAVGEAANAIKPAMATTPNQPIVGAVWPSAGTEIKFLMKSMNPFMKRRIGLKK